MRPAIALLLAALALSVRAAMMDPPQTPRERCEPIEYAELQDMSQSELAQAYCGSVVLAAQRQQEASVASGMAKATGGSWYARQALFERVAVACSEQAARQKAIYARRFGGEPSCAPR